MARLTTKDCERLLTAGVPEGRTVVKHSDGGGLYLVVRAGRDTASWLYHSRSGDHNLGSFPDVVPKAARDALVTYRAGLLATAADTPRQASKGGKPFMAVVAEWLKVRDWKPTTKDDATAALGRLSFAAKPINTITPAEVAAEIKALDARLKAARKSGRSAQDVRQWLKRIFDFAEYPGANPADFSGTRKEQIPGAPKKAKQKQHAAVEWEKLPAVYKVLPATEAARALKFLTLTAVRSGDIEQARWSQIQGENGTSVWVIPETKSGAELRVPLSPAALELLGDRGAPDVLIFSLKSNQMLNTLKAAAPGMTAHGCRATFKTWCGDNGHSREEAELSLAHKLGNAVEQTYNRTDLLKRRRKLMETWASFVTGTA